MTNCRQELSEYVDECSSVLLLAPQPSTEDDETCIDLLTGDDPEDANVLSVSMSRTPDERLALWQREVGDRVPKRTAIVDAGSTAAVDSQAAATAEVPSISVDALPADVTVVDIGIAIARYLSAWESNPESTFLCLHSLTTLLDRFERERVLSLVRGLNDLADCMDVVAHHHLDPSAHPEETVATFRPQYDTVLEHLPGNGWVITGDDGSGESSSRRRPDRTEGAPARLPGRSSVPLPYSLDTVLTALSVARRRSLLYYLRDRDDDAAVSVDELAAAVQAREDDASNQEPSAPSERIWLSLAHTHLPKLDDAGILDYDAEAGVVDYDGNPAFESCLDYVETLESG